MKKALLFIAGITLCILGIWIFRGQLFTGVQKATYEIPRQIRYGFTLSNKSDQLLEKTEFWTYAPVKQTATQQCEHIEASQPYELVEDELGNQILHFTFENFPPYASRVLTIKADLMMSGSANPIKNVGEQRFLKPEKFVESTQPSIVNAAQPLKMKEPSKTAERTFNFVSENISYAGYIQNERGALYALTHKKGDCTEYMYLFVALCRANTIPSRGIGGYICAQNMVLAPEAYHNWAEFYEKDVWKIADPQNKVFQTNSADYVAMRIIKESTDNDDWNFDRFRVKGEGLQVKMN